ncbi:MAG: hypothetical protein E4H20_05135 [Spirochaetales bacterium]|nr:MAG: hypothetical protein E4H20_05135 [Spirochaetales bacterium]
MVLVDMDLGGANLHTCLGVRNWYSGVGSIVWRKETNLEALVVPTDLNRLFLVPGDNRLHTRSAVKLALQDTRAEIPAY